MITRLLAAALLFHVFSCYAQFPEEITEADLTLFRQKIQEQIPHLKEEISKRKFTNEVEKALVLDYELATFQITKMMQMVKQKNYSTQGMIEAAYNAEIEYDKLLNKYYKILLNKLNESDRESLKKAQQSWIKFRDSERDLVAILSNDEYTGGGTMHRVAEADYRTEITKKRVADLFNYVIRFEQNPY